MTSAELITELQAARPTADGALRETRPGDRRRRAGATADSLRPAVAPLAEAIRARRRSGGRRRPARPRRGRRAARLGLTAAGRRRRPRESRPDRDSRRSPHPPGRLAPQLKAGAASAATDAATPAPTPGRAQRYSAQLTLSVKDVDALSSATQQALRITRDLGGYLVTVSYATSDTGVSSLTLKVPTANVQDAIVRLSGLGKIVVAAGSDRRPAGPGRRADEARDGAARSRSPASRPASPPPVSTPRPGPRSRHAATPPAASSPGCGSPAPR